MLQHLPITYVINLTLWQIDEKERLIKKIFGYICDKVAVAG